MSNESILSQIKNNIEWLGINTKGKTWQDILNELDDFYNDLLMFEDFSEE